MKLLGISSSKIASIAFLLMTLLFALLLSGMEFLKSSNAAEVPVFREGIEGEDDGDEDEGSAPAPVTENEKFTEGGPADEEEEENTDGFAEGNTPEKKKIEGFEIYSNTARSYTPFNSQ
jgi:hypothetical protein